jgi:hypothetical protein
MEDLPMRHWSLITVLALWTGLVALPTMGGVRINEFLASNGGGLLDENNDASDWIEIYNADTVTVDLAGWYLTDDSADLDKWQFPSRVLTPGQFLVVFASDKDRRPATGQLHTNFKLSAGGEYLGLVGTNGYTVVHAYDPAFPPHLPDVSYGISSNLSEAVRYFATPTPGATNSGAYLGLVKDTKFSVDRGFYTQAFDVEVSCATDDAEIRYTRDGSAPSPVHGEIYSGPVSISNTTPLRAIAWKTGWRASDVDTHTYIFTADVIVSDVMGTNITRDPVYGPQMTNALLDLPTISIVTTSTNIDWSPELPASVEWILPGGEKGFQVNAGISRYGGYYLPIQYEKRSFRLYFRSE